MQFLYKPAFSLGIIFLVCHIVTYAQLSGTYTINPSKPASASNYKSFGAAIMDLDSGKRSDGGTPAGPGISSAVIFTIASGIYQEQLHITPVSGASASKRILFKSDKGVADSVIITQQLSQTGNDYTLFFDDADFISFRNVSIRSTSAHSYPYGKTILIENGACSVHLEGNNIRGGQYAIYSNTASDTGIRILSNHISHAEHAISLGRPLSNSGADETGTQISRNVIDSVRHGIKLFRHDRPVVSYNVINNLELFDGLPYEMGSGIAIDSSTKIYVVNNKLNLQSGTGIFLKHCQQLYGVFTVVANNMIHVGGYGAAEGIRITECSYMDIVFNTINVSSPHSQSIALNIKNERPVSYYGLNLWSNIAANTGDGMALYISDYAAQCNNITYSDYNCYYATGPVFAYRWGAEFSNWSKFHNYIKGLYEQHSLSANPRFVSDTDLHVNAPELNNSAYLYWDIRQDIDQTYRNNSKPDIGADEFTPVSKDLRLLKIMAESPFCGDSTIKPGVAVYNNGTSALHNYELKLEVSGALQKTLSIKIPDTLQSGEMAVIYFTDSFSTVQGGNFYLKAYHLLSNDAVKINDTVYGVLTTFKEPSPPQALGDSICNPGLATLVSTSPTGFQSVWYQDGIILHTGDTFKTSKISHTKKFQVEARQWQADSLYTNRHLVAYYPGYMTNIISKKDLSLDSISFKVSYKSSQATYARLYYKDGSYIGHETDPANWLLLDSIPVTSGVSNMAFKFPSIDLRKGYNYSFYIMLTPKNLNGSDIIYGGGANKGAVNNDIAILSSTGLGKDFGSLHRGLIWDGKLFYHMASCPSSQKEVTVKVNKLPEGGIAKGQLFQGRWNTGTEIDPDVVCAGNTVSYKLKTPTGFSNSSFGITWSYEIKVSTDSGWNSQDTAILTPTATDSLLLKFSPGSTSADSTFRLELRVIDLKTGCDSSFYRYIYVAPVPEAKFYTADVCNKQIVSFYDSSSHLKDIVSYSLFFGDGTSFKNSVPKNTIHLYSKPGTYTAKLAILNKNGCSDTFSTLIRVDSLPVVNFKNVSGCVNNPVQFLDSSYIPSGNLKKYTWSFGDGKQDTIQNPVHVYTSPGTYNVKLKVTSDRGCSDSVTHAVEITSIQLPNFSYQNTCLGDSTKFTIIPKPQNYTYHWVFGDNSTSSSVDPRHLYPDTGAYTVNLIVRNEKGCNDTISRPLHIRETPQAGFIHTKNCAGAPVQFTNTSKSEDTSKLIYNWSFGDFTSSTEGHPAHQYKAGNYEVRLQVSNGFCIDEYRRSITIQPEPISDFGWVNNCSNEVVQFNNLSTTSSTNVTYHWDFDDGKGSTDKHPNHKYSPGNYQVTLKIIDSLCEDIVSKPVVIYNTATPDFTVNNICLGDTLYLSATTLNDSDKNVASWTWRMGDNTRLTGQNNQHLYSSAGNYDIWLKTVTVNGCSDSVKRQIAVYSLPEAEFSYSIDDRKVSFKPISSDQASYKWHFGDGDSSDIKQPVKIYVKDGSYIVSLEVYSTSGCKAVFSDTLHIKTSGLADNYEQAEVKLHPNPFGESFNISYSLHEPSEVQIRIYDIVGQELESSVSTQSSGKHSYEVDLQNKYMPAGIYFVQVRIGNSLSSFRQIKMK